MILILLRVNDRDLPLAERAVKRAVDCLRLNAKARGRIAIDHDGFLQAAKLLVAGRVLDLRIFVKLVHELRRPRIELIDVLIGQRILVLRF